MSDDPGVDPDFDRVLYRSARLTVGAFRAEPAHSRFADSGPIAAHIFVFPRTSVSIRHEDGCAFVAGPPVVTFYNRGQRYRRDPLSPQGDRCEWFALAPELLAEVVAPLDPAAAERPDSPFSFAFGPSSSRAYLRQRRLVERFAAPEPSDALRAEETALALAHEVVADALALRGVRRPPAAKPRRAARRNLAEGAKQLLLARFREPLGLEDLARELDTSPFHLCRVFRRETGWSLHRFRDEARLRSALEEIPARRGDLTALALDLGYSSHSHFTAAFRRAFGVTPSDMAGG